jgi:hypothetical protein
MYPARKIRLLRVPESDTLACGLAVLWFSISSEKMLESCSHVPCMSNLIR